MATTQKLTAREQRVEDWFEVPMLIVTIALIVTLVIPFVLPLSPWWIGFFATLNLAIWFSFYIELFTKIYVAKNKWQSVQRNWLLIVIAISPLFLPFRFVRISRLVSLVRILGLQRQVARLKRQVRDFIYNVEYIFFSIIVFVFVAAFVMWQVELRFDGTITSLPDALWWAVITITTIGYGDQVPTSQEGKMVGAVVGLLGTVLFMVFIARITAFFVHSKDVEELKKEVRRLNQNSK